MTHDPDVYRALAERSWAWAQTQVRADDDGLWLPETAEQAAPNEFSSGLHSGVGGLAHVLAEIRLTRELSSAELLLGDAIAETLVSRIADETEYDYFNGLVSTLGVLIALGAPGADLAVARLSELATPDGWQPSFLGPPGAMAEGRCNDVTLGTASVALGALWAMRYDVPGADDARRERGRRAARRAGTPRHRRLLAVRAVALPAEGRRADAELVARPGRDRRHPRGGGRRPRPPRPGRRRPARYGAPASGGDTSDGGLRFDHRIPGQEGLDTYTYTWCHGPAGTSLLFAALDRAGVPEVGGRTPYDWERACLHSLQVSGIPERRHPGFWDNDGRCCGTAGVGDVVRRCGSAAGTTTSSAFAVTLADAIVERAIEDGDHTYWRFIEHRNEDPLLPPGAGWMQGAAGIAAYLFRLARLLEQGRDAAAAPRMDTWWSLP